MSKYKLLLISFVVILMSLSMMAIKKVNNRNITTASEFTAWGAGPKFAYIESTSVELAYMLPKARRNSATWSACSVNTLWSDTINAFLLNGKLTGGTNEIETFLIDANNVDADTIRFANNGNGNPEHSLLKTSIVTIGHVGETTTDFAFTTAANTTEQTLGTDTIPAWARILDVCLITTEAVAGITTSFNCDVGDGAGTDEYGSVTDMKALNAVIAGDNSEALLVQPIATATVIYVNATPAAENWSAMSGGEFTLITTYLDYGSVRAKYP